MRVFTCLLCFLKSSLKVWRTVNSFENLLQKAKATFNPSKLIYEPSSKNNTFPRFFSGFLMMAKLNLDSYTNWRMRELRSCERGLNPLLPTNLRELLCTLGREWRKNLQRNSPGWSYSYSFRPFPWAVWLLSDFHFQETWPEVSYRWHLLVYYPADRVYVDCERVETWVCRRDASYYRRYRASIS